MRRWLIVLPAVVVIAALSVVGYALARTSSSQTGRDRSPTIAAFCSTHTSHAGFWAGYGGNASFLRMAVHAARWDHRQFEGVAGTLCRMLHRLDTGHTVLVPGPGSPAHARRRLHGPQLVRAIRELERLPDVENPT